MIDQTALAVPTAGLAAIEVQRLDYGVNRDHYRHHEQDNAYDFLENIHQKLLLSFADSVSEVDMC